MTNSSPSRNIGGRAIGNNEEQISHLQDCFVSACHKITELYKEATIKTKENGKSRNKKGLFNKIHNSVKASRNLPETFKFPYETAKKRIWGNTQVDEYGVPVGKSSPLFEAEDMITDFIVQLSKIGSPVTCGEAVFLINDLIEGTEYQAKLVEWKTTHGIKQSPEDMKRIGKSYWYSFLHRNEKKIRSKKGRKYKLDRSNWTKYRNFKNMYDDVKNEMVEAGLATKLLSPVSIDDQGKIVDEKDGVGMRIQVNLHRPDMCVVLDEVGCNLNMTKDGHTGGTEFVVGKDIEAKTKATKREKHFTCLGLTALSGQPIMCVVIIDQK
jgi:hypothetical protein